jgi:predicted MFS family arabinose efflux permease
MALIGFLGVCIFAVIVFVWFITYGPSADGQNPEEAKDLFTKTLIISTLLIILLGVIGSFIS